MSVRNWFEKNIPGGLDDYLKSASRDIEEVEKAETRAKIRLDFIKLVEQILGTLDHLNQVNDDKQVIFNFGEVTKKDIDEHWSEEDGTDRSQELRRD